MIRKKNQLFIQSSGVIFFLCALFLYFKIVTAPTRWVVWSFRNIPGAFKQGAGNEAIRPEAMLMKKMANKRLEKSYRLFGELKTNSYISYPARDTLYPIRITDDGPLLFAKKSEQLDGNCHQVDEEGDVSLYECPLP